MRFLHTADWQIGMKALAAGERAAEVRDQRVATVRNVVRLANERDVDLLLVAGDQFEDRAPSTVEIGHVASALADARMPVVVIPGNHDPAVPDSPYTTRLWRSLGGDNVTTVMTQQAIEFGDAVLFAAPCSAKYGTGDPTATFREMPSPEGKIRIGAAHGTLRLGHLEQGDAGDQRGGFPIALDAASRAGLAYLALGHWHSYLAMPDRAATIAYSGTPEQTRYDDGDCGTVSIVTIDGPHAAPAIERVRVGRYVWSAPSFNLSDDPSVERAIAELRAWPNAVNTLLRPTFRGLASPHGTTLLTATEPDMRARFLHFDPRRTFEERPANAQAWADRFEPGLQRTLAQRLLARTSDPKLAPVATLALQKMLELTR
jgi:DNA repair exonuclease SbcCD nuclease subunit